MSELDDQNSQPKSLNEGEITINGIEVVEGELDTTYKQLIVDHLNNNVKPGEFIRMGKIKPGEVMTNFVYHDNNSDSTVPYIHINLGWGENTVQINQPDPKITETEINSQYNPITAQIETTTIESPLGGMTEEEAKKAWNSAKLARERLGDIETLALPNPMALVKLTNEVYGFIYASNIDTQKPFNKSALSTDIKTVLIQMEIFLNAIKQTYKKGLANMKLQGNRYIYANTKTQGIDPYIEGWDNAVDLDQLDNTVQDHTLYIKMQFTKSTVDNKIRFAVGHGLTEEPIAFEEDHKPFGDEYEFNLELTARQSIIWQSLIKFLSFDTKTVSWEDNSFFFKELMGKIQEIFNSSNNNNLFDDYLTRNFPTGYKKIKTLPEIQALLLATQIIETFGPEENQD